MIQLVFDARDAREALVEEPVSVGYSSHEGAEQADWGEEKLELVDGTHPVVYPAAGSHANKFNAALYIGSSAEAGSAATTPEARTTRFAPSWDDPERPRRSREAFPWIAFEGRWGELQKAFFNGPTGPNLKKQWTEPIMVAALARPQLRRAHRGRARHGRHGLLLQRGRDRFRGLTAPESGTRRRSSSVGTSRPSARGGEAHDLASVGAAPARAPTGWGQILTASGRMYVQRAPLFLGIGLLFIPLGILIALVQALLLGGFGLFGIDTTGETAGVLALLVAASGPRSRCWASAWFRPRLRVRSSRSTADVRRTG